MIDPRILHANKELNRAELARQVAENEVYQEAFISLKAQLMQGFQNTKFKESDNRDEIWRKMQTVNYIEEYLAEIMETGKMARETLSTLDKAKSLIGL